jgi:hypothetical protein
MVSPTINGYFWPLATLRQGLLWFDSVEKVGFGFHGRKVHA